ncbi:hypothetical protein PCANC_10819 [Puccinia coronata f. sp. avenae]|uniref:Uncharacterized protein n=1 Tax=Puccinia coronata f. sp. avenae TaxID=200324 RepID=A0A2N5V0W9_9BASI|nr:hypothetical protein PCANC_10819 [Puccinia coronata f. sp. avenae]
MLKVKIARNTRQFGSGEARKLCGGTRQGQANHARVENGLATPVIRSLSTEGAVSGDPPLSLWLTGPDPNPLCC